MTVSTSPKTQANSLDELRNFEELVGVLTPSPGGIPVLPGVEIYGVSIPLSGSIGGDHTIFIDFNQRYDLDRRIAEADALGQTLLAQELKGCRERAGVLLADVSGHRVTDALIAAMLHQAFLLGVYYELDRSGHITTKLFEYINQRFYKTTGINKYLTMIYGEISTEGSFRFISAGHPRPMIFSREFGRFASVAEDRLVSYPPVGMFASKASAGERADPGRLGFKELYTVNEIDLLGRNDILLLYTDGLAEHADGRFFPHGLEAILASCESCSSKTLARRIHNELLAVAEPEDDVSFVVVQRTAPLQNPSTPGKPRG